jgi:hypothetical protein
MSIFTVSAPLQDCHQQVGIHRTQAVLTPVATGQACMVYVTDNDQVTVPEFLSAPPQTDSPAVIIQLKTLYTYNPLSDQMTKIIQALWSLLSR